MNYNLRNNLQVVWRENKTLLVILGLFALGGMVLGMIVAFNPIMHHQWISRHLLDGNVLNVTAPNRGIFAFLFARLLDVGFGALLLMLFNLTKWTMLLSFPYIAFRAFWMVINLFWIIDAFGFVHGLLFFVFYFVVFIALLLMFMCAAIFALKRGKHCRMYGWRVGLRFSEIKGAVLWFTAIVAILAFIEWLIYFLILSRMVYVVL